MEVFSLNQNSKYYINLMLKFLILGFIALGIFAAYKIAIFYIPFLIAFAIACIVEPVIGFFMKYFKLKRKLASILSLLIILMIIVLLLFTLITNLVSEATSLINNLNVYFKEFYDVGIHLFEDFRSGNLSIPNELLTISNQSFDAFLNSAKDFIISILNSLVNTITSIPSLLTYGIITILAIIFMCFDKEYVRTTVRKHVPKSWIESTKKVFSQMCSVSFRYIKAEAKLSGICFLLVLTGLTVMKLIGVNIQYPIIMAIVIGFVDLLPLFGAGTVMLPWGIYLLMIGNHPVALTVLGIWIVWAILKQMIEPHFVSKEMGMHPLFTLVGMYTGFKLFGILGLILGPITLLILKNVFQELFSKGLLKSIFEKD